MPEAPSPDLGKNKVSSVNGAILTAVLLTIASHLFFTSSHGIVRHLGGHLHPLQIAFFSNLFSALFYVPWLVKVGPRAMKTSKFKIHMVRAVFNAAALSFFYAALTHLPLADVTAIMLAAPIVVTLGALLFLGEVLRLRRWLAILVGAFGALIIVRPGFETVSIGILFIGISIVLSAGTKLMAKHLSGTDSAVVCSAYVAILQTPITFVLALAFWKTPTLPELAFLAGVGILVALAHITMVRAFILADVSALEPFVFVRLLFAAVIGLILFNEFPDLWTWIGAAVIVASTTYILRREAREKDVSLIALTPGSST